MTVEELIGKLRGVKKHGTGWQAYCPVHESSDGKHDASMSVDTGDRKILLHCHLGCSIDDICAALKITLTDLFLDSPQTRDRSNGSQGRGDIIAEYDYHDVDGSVSYQVVRLEPKEFRARRPDGKGGWSWKLGDQSLLLYHLPEVHTAIRDGHTVYITEGEKDADNLRKFGVCATTAPFGAKAEWKSQFTAALKGAIAVILSDNDVAGAQHAAEIAKAIHGVAAEVRWPTLPGLGPLKEKHGEDVSDWLAQGHTIAELEELAFDTEPLDPATLTETPIAPAAETLTAPSHWQRLDLAHLPTWQVKALEPLIDGIVARGNLVLNAAESQTGKTLLSLYLSRMLLQGGKLFGRYDVTPVDRLLYLVLEDPARRIQARLLDIQSEFDPVEPERCVFHVAPGFTLMEPRMWSWLERVIVSEGRNVVFLDTYQKATPGISSFDDVAQSKILHPLSDLTRRLEITLFVNDHFRKHGNGKQRQELTIDEVKGSGGKVQNADCVIMMQRTADRSQIKFTALSKEWDTAVRILLNVSPRGSTGGPKFSYAGDLEKLGSESRAKGEQTKARVLAALSDIWKASTELAKQLKIGSKTVQRHLQTLIQDGAAVDNGITGRYCAYRLSDNSNRTT